MFFGATLSALRVRWWQGLRLDGGTGQVGDAPAILAVLMPVFVDLMMDNPHEDRGHGHSAP